MADTFGLMIFHNVDRRDAIFIESNIQLDLTMIAFSFCRVCSWSESYRLQQFRF